MQQADGRLVERIVGTPQGGVVSPILSNLFLHYVFDTWMQRSHPFVPWCRYADDGVVHCKTEAQAQRFRADLERRFAACELQLHPVKTKIVYCKDWKRTKEYPTTRFEFLGYEFRPRRVPSRQRGDFFVGFTPVVYIVRPSNAGRRGSEDMR